MLPITHTCQFTTISTAEQPKLLPKPNTKSIVWEHFGLQAGKDGKHTDAGQVVHIKFVNGLLLLKMEIAKFVVCINKFKKS